MPTRWSTTVAISSAYLRLRSGDVGSGRRPARLQFVQSFGGRHRPIRMVRSRVDPMSDVDTLTDMWRLFRSERRDALFAYTIKSVVYGCVGGGAGGCAAHLRPAARPGLYLREAGDAQ